MILKVKLNNLKRVIPHFWSYQAIFTYLNLVKNIIQQSVQYQFTISIKVDLVLKPLPIFVIKVFKLIVLYNIHKMKKNLCRLFPKLL